MTTLAAFLFGFIAGFTVLIIIAVMATDGGRR